MTIEVQPPVTNKKMGRTKTGFMIVSSVGMISDVGPVDLLTAADELLRFDRHSDGYPSATDPIRFLAQNMIIGAPA